MQFVERFAFEADKVQAFVLRTLEVAHEQFDRWFDRCPSKLVLVLALFAASLETEQPVTQIDKHINQEIFKKTLQA